MLDNKFNAEIYLTKEGLVWDIAGLDEPFKGVVRWLPLDDKRLGQVLIFKDDTGFKRLTVTIENAELEHAEQE